MESQGGMGGMGGQGGKDGMGGMGGGGGDGMEEVDGRDGEMGGMGGGDGRDGRDGREGAEGGEEVMGGRGREAVESGSGMHSDDASRQNRTRRHLDSHAIKVESQNTDQCSKNLVTILGTDITMAVLLWLTDEAAQ